MILYRYREVNNKINIAESQNWNEHSKYKKFLNHENY